MLGADFRQAIDSDRHFQKSQIAKLPTGALSEADLASLKKQLEELMKSMAAERPFMDSIKRTLAQAARHDSKKKKS